MTAPAEAGPLARWLPFPPSDDGVRLYCFPHAGGSASTFRTWTGRIPGVALYPLQPPGRETRIREEPFRALGPMVAELADVVLCGGSAPYALYGHSLGGLVAFEVAREIRRRGAPQPSHLIVSGCAAPDHDPGDTPSVADLDDPRTVEVLRRLGGTPEWVLRDPSALGMILPPFRSDFAVKESHRYLPEPPLDLPVTVLAATRDPQVPLESTAGWHRQTRAEFRRHLLEGGHFAALQQTAPTHRYISEALHP
ncbi:thioesterase II family protein [Streptomyces sp. NPDC056452]|uniref:thioesterase II family protein n=1 Tax=Streptomyces sp. NPDC056452 TaxID=3345821 RepID=UPI0036C097A1